MLNLEDINRKELDYVLTKPGVVLASGMIGAGKTSGGFKIMEEIHKVSPERPLFVHCLGESKAHRLKQLTCPLPIIPVLDLDTKQLPDDAVLLADESWATRSSKVRLADDEKKELMDNLFFSRQRGQTIISIIQSLAILEKTHFRSGFSLLSSYVPVTSLVTERSELLDILVPIQRGIASRMAEYPLRPFQSWYHIRSPFYDFNHSQYSFVEGYCFGYYAMKLPSFWSNELSVLWSRMA